MRRAASLQSYVAAVVILAGLILATNRPALSQDTAGMVFFLLLVFFAEAVPIPLPKASGTVSVGAPVIHSIFILYGPAAAAWSAAFGTLRPIDLTGKVPIRSVLFNRAMLAIAAWVGGQVYVNLGGEIGHFTMRHSTVPFVLAALTYTLVNAALAVGFFVIRREGSARGLWRMNMRWALPNLFALMPLSVLIAVVYQAGGPAGVAMFFVPLLMARQAYQRYIDMRTIYLQTMLALSTALDAKDSYTRGHSERVARYAVAIGRELGVGDEDLELLEYVGILHDIGKIGIRDDVLKKPGLFTSDEYDEMKRHPELGADIIGGIKLLGRGSDWVRYHHERYDGTGFPSRLKGDEIPLGARIISVADAYDAMTSERPYKPAFDQTRAVAELQACAGTQFDPAVVRAFIRTLTRTS